jgi:hypothetical protein
MDQQSISFTDLDDGDEGTVIVRRVEGGVGLAVSKRSDGDVEALIPLNEAERVAAAIRAACES